MRRHTSKIEGRVSYELRALVEQGGELSASLRAPLIIGGAACGLNLMAVRKEIADLISCRLRLEVRTQLLKLMANGHGQSAPASVAHPTDHDVYAEEEQLLGDADGAGFDV